MVERVISGQSSDEQKSLIIAMIDDVAANLSHDLSNPMMVFNNVIEIIREKNFVCSKHELKKYIKILESSSLRLNLQIKTLSYFNSQMLHIKKTPIIQIIKKIITQLQISSSIKVILPDKDVDIDLDVEKMEMVLLTLIGNAIRSINEGGILMIQIKESDEYVTLEIKDTGDGIPLEMLPNLFEPEFFNRKMGPCLGFPMCKRIVKKHEGEISVESNPFGTTFHLKLLKKLDVRSNLNSLLSNIGHDN